MKDLQQELISFLETGIPELQGKIQTEVAKEPPAVPFATFFTQEQTPMRTIHGTMEVVTSFQVAVFEYQIAALEKLKHRAIAALEGKVLADRRCSFKSASTDYCPDLNIYKATLLFRIM